MGTWREWGLLLVYVLFISCQLLTACSPIFSQQAFWNSWLWLFHFMLVGRLPDNEVTENKCHWLVQFWTISLNSAIKHAYNSMLAKLKTCWLISMGTHLSQHPLSLMVPLWSQWASVGTWAPSWIRNLLLRPTLTSSAKKTVRDCCLWESLGTLILTDCFKKCFIHLLLSQF